MPHPPSASDTSPISDALLPDQPPDPSFPAEERPTARKRRTLLREVLELATLGLVFVLMLRQVLMPYAVDGASMNPFLENGEHLFVNRLAYADINLTSWLNGLPGVDIGEGEIVNFGTPARGDIVVLNPPTDSVSPYVKRVIALPGETVSFREGLVFVNGQPLTESYIDGAITFCRVPVGARGPSWCSLTVPEDSVYVLGDNRGQSSDSRAFGPVKISAIVGKVVFTNWPLDRFGPVPAPDYDITMP